MGDADMNGSTGTLLVLVIVSTAVALFIASPSVWNRSRRARRMALVDGILVASYLDPMHIADRSSVDDGDHVDGHRDPRPVLDPLEFDAVLAHEDAREARYRRPTTVVLLELDGLDRLIDRLGIEAGHRIEPDVAATITRQARRADYVARLGPGRYAVLMPETDEIAAINFVERIRESCDQWLHSGAIAVRLAIGWASTSGAGSVSTAMQVAADRLHDEIRHSARLGSDGTPGDVPAA